MKLFSIKNKTKHHLVLTTGKNVKHYFSECPTCKFEYPIALADPTVNTNKQSRYYISICPLCGLSYSKKYNKIYPIDCSVPWYEVVDLSKVKW